MRHLRLILTFSAVPPRRQTRRLNESLLLPSRRYSEVLKHSSGPAPRQTQCSTGDREAHDVKPEDHGGNKAKQHFLPSKRDGGDTRKPLFEALITFHRCSSDTHQQRGHCFSRDAALSTTQSALNSKLLPRQPAWHSFTYLTSRRTKRLNAAVPLFWTKIKTLGLLMVHRCVCVCQRCDGFNSSKAFSQQASKQAEVRHAHKVQKASNKRNIDVIQ